MRHQLIIVVEIENDQEDPDWWREGAADWAAAWLSEDSRVVDLTVYRPGPELFTALLEPREGLL